MHRSAEAHWLSRNQDLSTLDRYSTIKEITFTELENIFASQDNEKFLDVVSDLAKGAILVIRNCFSDEEIGYIKSRAHNLMTTTSSTFYRMNSLIPDFWRDITEEHSKKYGVPVIKQSAYFFPWNKEDKLFRLIYRRWRIIKSLGGREQTFAEHSEPKDGYVDRIQVVKYPSGTGYLSAHQDPIHNQRLFISGYLSKLGHDFNEGGFWALNQHGIKVNLEDMVNPGDMGIGFARIIHGVDQIDNCPDSERWFLGLYTNDSDLVTKRKTLAAPKMAIE